VSDSTARREAAGLSNTIRVKTNRSTSHPTRFHADRVAQPLGPAPPADAVESPHFSPLLRFSCVIPFPPYPLLPLPPYPLLPSPPSAPLPHSWRSAISGSVIAARRAGTNAAAIPTMPMMAAIVSNATGSTAGRYNDSPGAGA